MMPTYTIQSAPKQGIRVGTVVDFVIVRVCACMCKEIAHFKHAAPWHNSIGMSLKFEVERHCGKCSTRVSAAATAEVQRQTMTNTQYVHGSLVSSVYQQTS